MTVRLVVPVRRRTLATLGAAALTLLAQPARSNASAYPDRPIRLIVPWAPGTPADVSGRILVEPMAATLGQPFEVENRPGASGTIGLAEALRLPADGYTVVMLSSPMLMAPLLYPKQPIDPVGRLDPVGLTVWSYNVLVTPTDSSITSATDLAGLARARNGALSFASGGYGTPAHLAAELFRQQTGVPLTHVPYVDFPKAIDDLTNGRVDFMFLTASAAIPLIAAGRLRALAVTGSQRIPALAAVPTMAEQGHDRFEMRNFDGLMVRRGTPAEVVQRLNAELREALAQPDVRAVLDRLALHPDPMTPQKFRSVILAESIKWLGIGKAAGMTPA